MKSYQADRAVEKRPEDLLGRVEFAEAIADKLHSWRENASLVVGLSGPWGSGKTSIKNFVVDALMPDGLEKRADVIQINPWELSGTHDIESHFFATLDRFLTRKAAPAQDLQIARRLRIAVAALGIGEALTQPLIQPISSSIVAIGITTMGIGAFAPERGGWVLAGAILALVGHMVSASKAVAERIATFLDTRSGSPEPSAAKRKQALADVLTERELPLIIVIDEIDRLSADEIRLIFRLVKANGDLPRILYLLVFERSAVTNTLERQGFESGEAYLEKIIQAPFDVPAVQRTLLHTVLVRRRDEILATLPQAGFDEARWMDSFHQRLWVYFESLRDVYRFLAVFEFHVGVFRHRSSIEVNLVDLFVLEVLRVFEPAVYRALPNEKLLLTRGSTSPYERSSRDADDSKKRLNTLVALASQTGKDVIGNILADLFPRTAWAFGGSGYHTDFDVRWTKEKRVCSSIHFDKYFQAAVPFGEIRQDEIDEFVSSTSNDGALRDQLRILKSDGRAAAFLMRLEFEQERLPLTDAAVVLTTLFNEFDDLPDKVGILGSSGEQLLSYVTYHYLRRFRKHEEREDVLARVIAETSSLYQVVKLVAWEEPTDNESDRDYLISPQALPRFRAIAVDRLRSAAESGQLLGVQKLSFLLHYWSEWASIDEARDWCSDVIVRPHHAAALVSRFIHYSTSQGMGSVVAFRHSYLDMKALEKFIDPAAAEIAVENPPQESLGEEEEFAANMLREAMNRRRAGKPDRGPGVGARFDDEDDEPQ